MNRIEPIKESSFGFYDQKPKKQLSNEANTNDKSDVVGEEYHPIKGKIINVLV